MLSAFAIPISWGELIKRTIKEANADNVLGLAAQLAYYFLLALVPAIVFIVALTSFFPADTIERMAQAMGGFVPASMMDILQQQLDSLRERQDGGLLSFGLLMAVWSSSAAMVAVTDALNRAYDIDEARPWWKVRLTAIGLTVGLALFVITAFTLVVAGPELAESIAARVGLGEAFTMAWKVVQWPVAFAFVTLAIGLINYYGPDADQDWVWITPGAVLAAVLWLIASLAFRFYVTNFTDYNATYGSLGGVIILMLWFYISSLAILVGAELNAEIEHASPYGKEPGEKVPGEKKKIGARAKRAWEKRQQELPPRAGVGARHLVS
ncbi:MAG TPA: YihY/virulence factor BrkB family protein [Vicinamibacterales bacterium]|nr:YihY/virulence factor BrkB family protein [Vicinamibacterales bacterium]